MKPTPFARTLLSVALLASLLVTPALADLMKDSPVTFPEKGALPAKHPPDQPSKEREPAEEGYYIFSTPERSLAQIDTIQAEMPPGQFTLPKPDWTHLTRVHRILSGGGELRLLALGDSIINDTMRSGWVAKLRQAYPKATIQATVYVRGGGGCQHYKEEGRLARYVIPRRPDLVLIGGISQKDIESIREVIRTLRGGLPEVEILLTTGVFGTADPRVPEELAKAAYSGTGPYGVALQKLAAEERCAYLDMTTPWAEYIRSSKLHPHLFYRDAVHANEYGEQILSKILLAFFDSAAPASQINGAEGAQNPKTPVIRALDTLRYVESEYTRRFRFDTFANPKLKELREQYELDTVVAPGRDEFERQILLLDWVHHQFKKFGPASAKANGALEILKAIREGHTFNCSQYAQVFVSAAASLGWVDRELALRRHQDPPNGGSTEHSVTEIWSNQYGKWVMMDPTANMHIEKEGKPLNAFEIRQEWFYRDGQDLVLVIGKERKPYRKSDLPIFLGRFAGFGDLTVPVDELDKYGFIAYIPNTDLMDTGLDYANMFIVKDRLCDGTRWHTRTVPPNPAVDPYFPINQAALTVTPEPGQVRVTLQTMTPNFKAYQARIDSGAWTSSETPILWRTHPGLNRLEVRTVNQFGVNGPVSSVEVEQ